MNRIIDFIANLFNIKATQKEMELFNEIQNNSYKSFRVVGRGTMTVDPKEKYIKMDYKERRSKKTKQRYEMEELEYWKKRCLLAEKCLDVSPCDPDITGEQMDAREEYNNFLEDETPQAKEEK